MTLTFDPIGIALAVIFVASMAILFRWMFNVPPLVPQQVAAVCHAVGAMERFLVPVTSHVVSERAVELACRLGAPQKARIILAYVIEVPFTLALDARIPHEESRGQEALRTARLIAEQHSLPVETHLVAHRYASAGILQVAKENAADVIVMSIGPGRPGTSEGLGRTIDEVLRRANCEVIVEKTPCRTPPAPARAADVGRAVAMAES
ncbi:MAG: universal stress protein [Anaerolineae bacterium]